MCWASRQADEDEHEISTLDYWKERAERTEAILNALVRRCMDIDECPTSQRNCIDNCFNCWFEYATEEAAKAEEVIDTYHGA